MIEEFDGDQDSVINFAEFKRIMKYAWMLFTTTTTTTTTTMMIRLIRVESSRVKPC
jgi:hypothetical protein